MKNLALLPRRIFAFVGVVFGRIFPNAIIEKLRRPNTRQHLSDPPRNPRSPRHQASPARRARPCASHTTTIHVAGISSGVVAVFAVGLWTRRSPRQTRGQLDPILSRICYHPERCTAA